MRKNKKKGDREFSLLSLHSLCPAIGFPGVHCAAVVGQWPALREWISSDAEEANEGLQGGDGSRWRRGDASEGT
ncbi:hypothetical protein ES288_A06G059800v1 [Gossypium darwinii]|uniref:Uncharacterized protein n=1 Tax=Gossypium darwinii TaxID=34276 RepID=A0A5D2G4H4_GOSDA|nr:hypothetical protein ES288_A06G059800v1 [Gossypium darwinii]